MKILLVSALYPPYQVGGAEKAAALLAQALGRQGHEVVVVSLHPQSQEVVEQYNGVRVYRLPIDNLYWPFGRKRKPNALLRLLWHMREIWNPKAARRLARVLDLERPDVVHTHNLSGFSVAVWREVKRRDIRLVHTLHDYYMLCSSSSLFRHGRNCERRCLDCRALTFNRRRMSGQPDAVVSVSQHTLDAHLKRGFFQNVHRTVIPNIYPVERNAAPQPPAREHDPAVVFGFIGRIEEPKGIETVLAAVGRLEQPNWKLRVAGTGLDAYVRMVKAKFRDPRIEWMGFTDAARFYAGVDVVIIPSLWADPLPYVAVESLHTGKRMICASSGGIPEIARLSPAAEFFPAGDSTALSERMNEAMAQPQAPPRVDSAKLSVFSEAHVTRSYLREYAPADPA